MTSNSQAMTIEARIAQALKEDHLASLITEDELTEIIRKEIDESLQTRRMIPNPDRSYGKPYKIQSDYTIVQEWLRDAISPIIQEFMQTKIDSLGIEEKLNDIIAALLPDTIMTVVTSHIAKNLQYAVSHAISDSSDGNTLYYALTEKIRSRL